MDTLAPTKDVTVTAVNGSGADMATPAPQTLAADADGKAYVSMLIPAGYGDNKISFRIDKDVVLVDEFGSGNPATLITAPAEIHEVTVTA